ncbi:hypothetical protein Clacol_006581 [Clathrus columnatus]|uniref:DEAD/DEAH-box helicase domain-containing protein n=1 Tax=Clathrus columnatus TaxID=1419009 RepID=A0AAV5AK63_9AGAM|nr:hypothetical protein Clacol_006581 [Clathrus columnatus]
MNSFKAPTGSGKTVLFELAIVRLLSEKKGDELKCVYMAPTKVPCTLFRDISRLDSKVQRCELTGDTVEFNTTALREAKGSTIIYEGETTATFYLKSVHILNDTRGSTLEVVTSRMKGRNSLRFVVVSATVPNINDVAEWIGNESCTGPASVFTVDSEISIALVDYPGTVATAETLMKEYVKLLETKQHVPWVKPRPIDTLFVDQKLQTLALYGIGVHHAGLGLEDRRLVEKLFLEKVIQVVVATSTLAVGVNLRA